MHCPGGIRHELRLTQVSFDTATLDGVVDGLVSEEIPPGVWEACIELATGHLMYEESATLYDAMAEKYESLSRRP